jgi:O-antigen/teichoic acid export membrane protein
MQLSKKLNFDTFSLKSLFSDSIIYGTSSAINRLTIILILPFYAKLLPPETFVNINLISNFFILINIILFFGLDNIVAISYYNTDHELKRKKIFSTWFWFELLVNILCFIFLIILANQIVKGLTNTYESLVFIIAAASQLVSFPLYILSFYFRLQRKPFLNLIIISASGLFLLFFNVYFLFIDFREIQGYFLSQFCSNILISIISIYILKDWIKPSYFSFDLIKFKIKKSIGMLIANLSSWMVAFSSIYFIQYLTKDKSLAGIYQIVLLINTIISFIINAFAQALGPYIQSIKKDRNYAILQYKKIFLIYIIIAGFISTTVSIFSKELVLLVSNHEYLEAYKFILLISFSTFFNGLSFVGGIGFVVGEKVNLNKFGFLSSVSTLINILFFILLIPFFGLYGAAFSSFISSILLNLLIFYNAGKYLNINYSYRNGILLIFFYLLLSLLLNIFLNQEIRIESILIKLIIEFIIIFVIFKNKHRII